MQSCVFWGGSQMKKCFKYIVAGAFAVLMSFNAYAGTVTNSDAVIYVNGKIINGASAKISMRR